VQKCFGNATPVRREEVTDVSHRRHTLAARDAITLACPLTTSLKAESIVDEQVDAKSITPA
jgi:hypothetical protein